MVLDIGKIAVFTSTSQRSISNDLAHYVVHRNRSQHSLIYARHGKIPVWLLKFGTEDEHAISRSLPSSEGVTKPMES